MDDTIDLLERIGGDARLRHARGEQMQRTLRALQASDALLAAAAGDPRELERESGQPPTHSPHHVNQHCPGDGDGDGGDVPPDASPG